MKHRNANTRSDEDESDVVARLRRIVFWLAFWLIVQGVFVSFGFAQSLGNHTDLARLIRAEEAEDDIEEAVRCVEDWDRLSDLRRGIPIPTEALIRTFPSADPENIETFRRITGELLADAFTDPECDIEASRRLLGG